MPFLESFENVNQERGHEIVDPTNVPVERYWNGTFGLLEYAEKALPNLQCRKNIQWPNSTRFQKIYRILNRQNLSNFTPSYQFLRNG